MKLNQSHKISGLLVSAILWILLEIKFKLVLVDPLIISNRSEFTGYAVSLFIHNCLVFLALTFLIPCQTFLGILSLFLFILLLPYFCIKN